MKQVYKPILDFIGAFDLEYPLDVVCFDAAVFVFTGKLKFEFKSEVHIITIAANHLDVVYILNPELGLNGFPGMFKIHDVVIDYKQKKGLLIKGTAPQHGNYSILIQPTGKNCEEPAYEDVYESIYKTAPENVS